VNDVDDRRIERVEQLLRSAGPAPELPPGLADPPRVDEPARERERERPSARKSWLAVGFATAAAAAAIAFTVGYALGDRREGLEPVAEIAMHGVAPAAAASAELDIGEPDAAGNIPIEMRVEGLPVLPRGGWYELYLSKGSEIGASCGSFTTTGEETTVRLSVGYDLNAWRDAGLFDGWVITATVPGNPGSKQRILLTT
jgi:hypothetical protein